jgi:hypothetical protein
MQGDRRTGLLHFKERILTNKKDQKELKTWRDRLIFFKCSLNRRGNVKSLRKLRGYDY